MQSKKSMMNSYIRTDISNPQGFANSHDPITLPPITVLMNRDNSHISKRNSVVSNSTVNIAGNSNSNFLPRTPEYGENNYSTNNGGNKNNTNGNINSNQFNSLNGRPKSIISPISANNWNLNHQSPNTAIGEACFVKPLSGQVNPMIVPSNFLPLNNSEQQSQQINIPINNLANNLINNPMNSHLNVPPNDPGYLQYVEKMRQLKLQQNEIQQMATTQMSQFPSSNNQFTKQSPTNGFVYLYNPNNNGNRNQTTSVVPIQNEMLPNFDSSNSSNTSYGINYNKNQSMTNSTMGQPSSTNTSPSLLNTPIMDSTKNNNFQQQQQRNVNENFSSNAQIISNTISSPVFKQNDFVFDQFHNKNAVLHTSTNVNFNNINYNIYETQQNATALGTTNFKDSKDAIAILAKPNAGKVTKVPNTRKKPITRNRMQKPIILESPKTMDPNNNIQAPKISFSRLEANLDIAKRLRKQCPVCGKICSRPSTLKTHYLTHTGDTPFKCPWKGCDKSFNVKSNMNRHLKGHNKT